MNPDNYGLIEMALSFGIILTFCVWQLISVEKAKKITRARLDAEAAAKSQALPDGDMKKPGA